MSAILDIAPARMLQPHAKLILPLLAELRGDEEYRVRIEALLHALKPADGPLLNAPHYLVDAKTQAIAPRLMDLYLQSGK